MELGELTFIATLDPPATAEGTRLALEGVDRTDHDAVEKALRAYDDARRAEVEAAGRRLSTATWAGREVVWDRA